MATYFQYQLQSGKTKWGCKGYLGIDPSTGKQVTFEKRGLPSRNEARRCFAEAFRQYTGGEYHEKLPKYFFSEVYHMWLPAYAMDKKGATVVKAKSIFKHYILPTLGNLVINEITFHQLQRCLDNYQDKPSIYKRIYTYLSQLYSWAWRKEMIQSNPMKKVDFKKKISKPKQDHFENVYSREELADALNKIEKYDTLKWRCFFRLLAYSGMRSGEMCALRWSDFDFDVYQVEVNRAVGKDANGKEIIQAPKTKNGFRLISLDKETIVTCLKWKIEQEKRLLKLGFSFDSDKQFLFPKKDNSTVMSMNTSVPRNHYRKFCDDHGLRYITLHGFRHTHCSLLFESGANMKEVQERMGHKDITTTMNIYTHLSKKANEEVVKGLIDYMK